MKKILGLTLSVFAFAGFFLAIPAQAQKPANKEFRIGITQEFENLNPLISTMLATSYIYAMVGRGLMSLDENGKYEPQLVKEIPSLENGLAEFVGKGKNRKILAKYEIKEKATWGDGTPVTGYDVEFTCRVAQSPNVAIASREFFDNIEKITVDKKNPKKFTFLYKKAKWDFNRIAGFATLPKHLETPVFKEYGEQEEGYSINSLYTTDPTNPGLYNGPYVIKEIKLGSHVVVTPNPHFYGQQPKIQKIIIKLIPNTGTLEANLRSGQIDMISELGMTFDQALAFEKRVKEESLPYEVKYRQSLTYEHIDLQMKNKILQDKNIRKALVYAIDRDQLVKALFEGKQFKAIHNLAPIDPWYTDDEKKIVLYSHSRRKAKKFLEKSGWIPGENGYRYKDGEKLTLLLMTTAGNKTRELVEQYLQNEWKKVGIDIQIKNEPARVFFGDTVHKAKYPAMAMYAWISRPESTPRSTLHSNNIPSSENAYSGQNSGGWRNQEVDKLIEAIDLEFDDEKRLEMVHKILHFYTDEVPVIPLYYRAQVAVTPKNLKGHQLTGTQFSATNQVERWSLE